MRRKKEEINYVERIIKRLDRLCIEVIIAIIVVILINILIWLVPL